MTEEVEYDPNRSLWVPRRSFIFLGATALASIFIPAPNRLIPVAENVASILAPQSWAYFTNHGTTMFTYSIAKPNVRCLNGVTLEPVKVSDLPMQQQQIVAILTSGTI